MRRELFQVYIMFFSFPSPIAIFRHRKVVSNTWVSHSPHRIWRNSVSLSKYGRFRVLQLKIPHRAYILSRLKMMDQILSGLYWHVCREVCTLVHSLWLCPAVKALWDVVRDILSKILNTDIASYMLAGHPAH